MSFVADTYNVLHIPSPNIARSITTNAGDDSNVALIPSVMLLRSVDEYSV
jgi:hypothetical protein